MQPAMKNPLASPFLSLLVCLAALALHPAAAFAGEAGMPSAAEDVRAQLEAAKQTAAVIEASPNYAANAPAIATEDELKIRRFYAREAVRSYETVLRNASRRDELRRSLDEAKQQGRQWTGVPGGPPYSIMVVDQLAQEAELAQGHLASRKTRLDLTRSMRDNLSQSAKSSAAALRQIEEQAARGDAAERTAREWQIELARTRLRAQAAILKSLESAEEVAQVEISIAQAALELAQRKLAGTQGKRVFPEADFQRIKAELATEGAAVLAELTRAVDAAANAADRLERARHGLAQAQAQAEAAAANDARKAAAVETLKRDVLLAEIDASASNAMLDVLRFKPGVHELKRVIWDYRYRLYQERTPQVVADTRSMVDDQGKKLDDLARVAERRMTVLKGEITEIEQVLATATDSVRRELQAQLLAHDTEREKALRRLTAFYASTQSLLARLRDEAKIEADGAAPADRAATLALSGRKALGDIWDFEIFAIEDTIEVEGRKVTSLASVTVGKVVRALLIFTAGVLLSFWLGLAAEALVVRLFGYDAARARILRKWLFAVGLAVLLVAVLLWVRIPLTIFAFLGGAIAIGLGFGMRNLLQNLISGLMLLFERPFKPGDLVEIGNIRGNIVEIGIRSSVIRDVNGVDSLIPNSTFIEQNVTNWTYENPRVRFCIKVGIAYGSPVDDAARLLGECVERHGLVLADPAPEILFEDFGADALQFAVYYWLDLGPKVVARRVASDLRFMMEKTLREHGIVIAYPQRDVHLDAATPLRVQVVKE
jgi:potassium-dependent mechanosensitive channel